MSDNLAFLENPTQMAYDADSNDRYKEDKNLFVRFFMHPHPDPEATAREGRPIYYDREYVEIIVPGDKTTTINRPVRDMDKRRFAERYKAFKSDEQQVNVGTPLSAWPGITRSQVEELKYFKIFTVEQLVSIPDTVAQRFMGINILRKRASDFLAAAEGVAHETQLQSELEKRDNQIAALTNAVEELKKLVPKNKQAQAEQIQVEEPEVEEATSDEEVEDLEDR